MVDGFLIIDKPAGITSHDVVNRVRRILGTKKVGHTGTLDPFATGILPVAVNEATKAIQFLDEGKKRYEAVIRLGFSTDTLDITGNILQEKDTSTINRKKLLDAMAGLTGEIEQLPPMFSAIKHAGQPLYKLARKGIEVERQLRRVTISTFELLEFENPFATVRVTCSRGTYIRTLADDLGLKLGCGGCLTELRRTISGPFHLNNAITIEQLDTYTKDGTILQHLLPIADAVSHLEEIVLEDKELGRIKNGIPPVERLAEMSTGMFRLLHQGKLIAIAEKSLETEVILKRVFNN